MSHQMNKTVLILEDDERLAKSLAREFEDHGYFPHLAAASREIVVKAYDFAVVDLRLNGEFGIDGITYIKSFSPACRIVVLSGYGSIATAVEAVKRGAVDYLTKPASFKLIEAALLGQRKEVDVSEKVLSLSQVEHEYIDFVLTKNDGNISKTAKEIGLHRQSLQRKLKKYT